MEKRTEKKGTLRMGEAGGGENRLRPEKLARCELDESGDPEARTVEGLVDEDAAKGEI